MLFPQLVVINGARNEAANASVTAALKALRERHPGHLGNVWSVQINESDSSESLDIICDVWGSAVSRGGSAVPDLVLDVTTIGPGADASSSFTAAMGIPTLSAQYGQEGDIRYWRDLDLDQKNYLIQVFRTYSACALAKHMTRSIDIFQAFKRVIYFDLCFVSILVLCILLFVRFRNTYKRYIKSSPERTDQLV